MKFFIFYFFEVTYQLEMTLDLIFIFIQKFNIVKIKIDRYIQVKNYQ